MVNYMLCSTCPVYQKDGTSGEVANNQRRQMYGQFLDRGKANLFPSAGRRIVKMKLKVVAAT